MQHLRFTFDDVQNLLCKLSQEEGGTMQRIKMFQMILLSTLMLIGLALNSWSSPSARVSGTLVSSQDITFPQGAIAYITLVDVSPRQDVEAGIIARQTIANPEQLPIAFDLEYSPEEIHPDHRYAIQVQVAIAGQTIFRNRDAYPVITQGNPSVIEVLIEPDSH